MVRAIRQQQPDAVFHLGDYELSLIHISSPGTSMAPTFCARILTTGVSAKLTTNAMRIASMTLIDVYKRQVFQ